MSRLENIEAEIKQLPKESKVALLAWLETELGASTQTEADERRRSRQALRDLQEQSRLTREEAERFIGEVRRERMADEYRAQR